MDVFESIKVPTNTLLENQINKVVKQAEENYDKRNKNEMLLMVLFFCLTNAISGKAQTKTQTKTDTILCNNKNLIIKYPRISKLI